VYCSVDTSTVGRVIDHRTISVADLMIEDDACNADIQAALGPAICMGNLGIRC